MVLKRDNVNRKTRLVRLPIRLGGHIKVGDVIELANVVENEITPTVKDPMAGFGQPDGSNYGDAVFDPQAFDLFGVIGFEDPATGENVALGFEEGFSCTLIGDASTTDLCIFDSMMAPAI